MMLSRLFRLVLLPRLAPHEWESFFYTGCLVYASISPGEPSIKAIQEQKVRGRSLSFANVLDSRLEVPSSARRRLFGFLPQYELEIVLSMRAAVPKEAKQRKGRRIEGGGGDGEGKGTLWLCLLSDGRPRIRIGTT